MTLLDYFVLVVVGVSVVFGFIRGIIRSVISMAAALAGLIGAAYLYPYGARPVGWFVSHPAADFISFLLIFLLFLIGGALLSRVLLSAARLAHLRWADRLLGAGFGLVKAWLICSVIYLALTAFPLRIDAVERSAFSPVLLAGSRLLVSITSGSMKAHFWDGYGSVAQEQHRPNARRK
ncbi:MAG TPA: CvpA family protein [Blastocatellia bacterium]